MSAVSAAPIASLQRPFRAIVFDWDGTAVASRQEEAGDLARLIAELLARGVWIVVVTGTNVGHVERQLVRLVPPALRRRLLLCTNRGSEVYGFGPSGEMERRWRRVATPEEEATLTAIAEAVRDAVVKQTGLDIRIVYDRLNRRKIDLIPLAEWADPPKERIGELLIAVEQRLRGAGLAGGLGEAVRLAERFAAEQGLPAARVTSDVKHVEVGLTDKGDALAWIERNLLEPEGIPLCEVLLVGDEFGPLAGFAGSDDRMRLEAEGAVVVSVGREPNGVPPGVLHLPGGPPRFQALLSDQVRLHAEGGAGRERAGEPATDGLETAFTPPAESSWRLEERGYHPALEHEIESRLALGNGFLGVRASLEHPTSASRPRTLVAGLFDDAVDGPAVPALAAGPDLFWLRLALAGKPLAIEASRAPAHPRTLDLRRGLLLGEWLGRAADGRPVRMRTVRFVSLADRALAVQLARVEAEEPAPLELEARLRPPGPPLRLVRAEPGRAIWRASTTGRSLAVESSATLRLDDTLLRPASEDEWRRGWRWLADPEHPAFFARVAALARADSDAEAARLAGVAIRRARRLGPSGLLARQVQAWAERWAASDVEVDGDDDAQRALRFALYHLISAANPADERVSIGARALTGEAYLGHVFWDTEIFLLPFYTLTWPAAARALLMYRYHTLPGARAKAARLGYRGALYAWESADTGEEVTPPYGIRPDGEVVPIRCGTDEQHISADVAYAVWQYWLATADSSFLLKAGAEIILETARFWASRAQLEVDGRFHIRGVIGPDEYHEGVDDNAYTNVMARWNLERGVEVARLLQTRWPVRWAGLRARLGLAPAELAEWRLVAAGLVVECDAATGIVEQFAGYSGLEPIDLAAYAPRAAPMDVLLGRERTQRSQVVKQADVVMLLALLEDRFTPAKREANFRYYEPRCAHGSSLSPAVHALVAARLGDVGLAEAYFHQAAAIDLDDRAGNAALGVHIGALGGLWQAVVFGFAGLSLGRNGLGLDPRLPDTWQAVRFPLQWRGRQLRIEIRREPCTLTATLARGKRMRLRVGGQTRALAIGVPWTCPLGDGEAHGTR